MSNIEPDASAQMPPKKESMIGFFLGILIVTIIAVSSGWSLGKSFIHNFSAENNLQTTESPIESASDKKNENNQDEENPGLEASSGLVEKLDPIIVALSDSQNTFLRLELAVVTGSTDALNDAEKKVRLVNDISAFARTLSLDQISSPSGYIHFREDIIDRARISTGILIKDVLILSMVAE